jgi:hypothetical protein
MEAVVSDSEMLNIVSSSECEIVLGLAFSRTLKFVVHSLTLKCVFIRIMPVTRKCFRSV